MLMIGQVARFSPGFCKAKELVDAGRIGDLYFVESEYAHSYTIHPGVHNWRITPERNGFIGGGCHAVDLLRWIAGNPTEVMAYSNHKCLTDWPADDCTIGIYKFPNGVIGKVFASIGCCRNYTMRTCLYGTKGTIICGYGMPEITIYEGEGFLENGALAFTKPTKIPVEIKSHNVGSELEVFLEALVEGKPAPVPSIEGASTVAVCTTTVRSAHEGRPLPIIYPTV
jgi:predicted dehydrogenase